MRHQHEVIDRRADPPLVKRIWRTPDGGQLQSWHRARPRPQTGGGTLVCNIDQGGNSIGRTTQTATATLPRRACRRSLWPPPRQQTSRFSWCVTPAGQRRSHPGPRSTRSRDRRFALLARMGHDPLEDCRSDSSGARGLRGAAAQPFAGRRHRGKHPMPAPLRSAMRRSVPRPASAWSCSPSRPNERYFVVHLTAAALATSAQALQRFGEHNTH